MPVTDPRFVDLSDGRRLAYQEFGDPGGAPLFFFHGWLGSRLDFLPNDQIASDLGLRVLAFDRPGCGKSDVQEQRTLLDWPEDMSEAADLLGIDQFSVIGHSFGGPFVVACAYRLGDRLNSAVIVAGISPLFDGATDGMPGPVRAILWLGQNAPSVTRPYVSLMGRMAQNPSAIEKSFASLLPEDEAELMESPRFAGFFDNLGEMTSGGSKGAYWDARVFLGEWGFECEDVETPVSLFYGTADRNVPIQMGRYYERALRNPTATFYEGEGHFILYSRAEEILGSVVGAQT